MCPKLPMNPTNLMNGCLYRCDIHLVYANYRHGLYEGYLIKDMAQGIVLETT